MDSGHVPTWWCSPTAGDRRGASPTTRTYVPAGLIGERPRAFVDLHAERMLPGEVADLVRTTSTRTAVPLVDIATPRRMVFAIGSVPAVLIGDALAVVHPNTA